MLRLSKAYRKGLTLFAAAYKATAKKYQLTLKQKYSAFHAMAWLVAAQTEVQFTCAVNAEASV
jgi:hypothetical protein